MYVMLFECFKVSMAEDSRLEGLQIRPNTRNQRNSVRHRADSYLYTLENTTCFPQSYRSTPAIDSRFVALVFPQRLNPRLEAVPEQFVGAPRAQETRVVSIF